VYVPLKSLLPMVEPNDVEVGGWDICSMPLGDAMKKSKVLDVDLQRQLYDEMNKIVPLPSVNFPSFIAANQRDRADHTLKGSKQEQMDQLRKDIPRFQSCQGLRQSHRPLDRQHRALRRGVTHSMHCAPLANARGRSERFG
jgi:myo-inositol-1-phosphate synthase